MDFKLSDFFNLNIKKENQLDNIEDVEEIKKYKEYGKYKDIEEQDEKRKRSLTYNEKEYSILGSMYGLSKCLESRPLRRDGCLEKNEFENNYQRIPTIITKVLLRTVFIYLEEGRKCSYYDSYQENIGIEENPNVISESLIYTQIQRLMFKNANPYSYKKVPPLEHYFKKGKSVIISRILQSYFLAVYDVFGLMFLYSSDAFRLMIEIFPILYDIGLSKKDLTYEFFKEELEFISRYVKFTERNFLEDKMIILDKIYDTVVW